jgi:heat shock protein HtpX
VFKPVVDDGAWLGGRPVHCAIPGFSPRFSFALVAAAPYAEARQFSRSSTEHALDLYLPTDRRDVLLHCRIDASFQDLSHLRRQLQHIANYRSSVWAIGGMVLLLAVCGWIVGGAEGAHRAIAGSAPRSDSPAISSEAMYRWFGARQLRPMDMPGLFKILGEVCSRARLARLPDLYCVARGDMNAYALGHSEGSAVVLTEGLLRGMTRDEIAGILAHEVAHICNNDAWAMGWVAALHRAIEWTSSSGLASLQTQNGSKTAGPLLALLSAAPALGYLLGMALSRIRELDADATALEFTGDSQGLIAALDKLERHHNGASVPAFASCEDGSTRLLRSHPATAERVGSLRAFSR